MGEVRTRFAPSPTGFLHIGSARTALFNWAFARRHAGQFLLRVEDTDRERSSAENEAAILAGLRWLELDWDGEPVRQSARRERHDAVVEDLIAKGRAYRCICSRESLEERKQATLDAGGKWTYDGRCRDAGHGPDCGAHTVRLRLPEGGRLAWDDAVFGASGQDASEIGDRIIRRSDGLPLYHVAVVVDDLDMGISHVIRGADHHPNTPLQVALYRALDATPPLFAHVPLIVGPGGKKLSKRREDVSIQQLREAGYLPAALRSWLARLGWSHGDQEVFERDELASLFDLDSVSRSPAQVDQAKLDWQDQHWIKSLPGDALFSLALPFLEEEAGGPVADTPALRALLDLLRERSKTLAELAVRARFALRDDVSYEEKAARKHLGAAAGAPLAALRAALGALAESEWDEAGLETCFEGVLAGFEALTLGKLAQPVRVAVTGSGASPGIYETLAILGRERTLSRLDAALQHIRELPAD